MKGRKLRAASVVFFAAVLLMSLGVIASPVVRADDCTAIVIAPASIQVAIDDNPGGVVCLDDSGGVFSQSVVFGPEDSGITLTSASSAILDGTGLGSANAITLLDGVSEVTIEDLEIRNYPGPRGSAISTWDADTDSITVRNNYLHDNDYNGILVGSEGGFTHTDWKVEGNTVADNGFVGIELTNCDECTIEKNTVTGDGFAGIVIQARNTIPDSGSIAVSDVKVEENTVSGGLFGIYVLALASQPLPPFDPIDAATVLFEEVKVEKNEVDGSTYGILVWSFEDGTVDTAKIEENDVSGSGSFDLYDLGTDTIWEDNTCGTSSPTSLCS